MTTGWVLSSGLVSYKDRAAAPASPVFFEEMIMKQVTLQDLADTVERIRELYEYLIVTKKYTPPEPEPEISEQEGTCLNCGALVCRC